MAIAPTEPRLKTLRLHPNPGVNPDILRGTPEVQNKCRYPHHLVRREATPDVAYDSRVFVDQLFEDASPISFDRLSRLHSDVAAESSFADQGAARPRLVSFQIAKEVLG